MRRPRPSTLPTRRSPARSGSSPAASPMLSSMPALPMSRTGGSPCARTSRPWRRRASLPWLSGSGSTPALSRRPSRATTARALTAPRSSRWRSTVSPRGVSSPANRIGHGPSSGRPSSPTRHLRELLHLRRRQGGHGRPRARPRWCAHRGALCRRRGDGALLRYLYRRHFGAPRRRVRPQGRLARGDARRLTGATADRPDRLEGDLVVEVLGAAAAAGAAHAAGARAARAHVVAGAATHAAAAATVEHGEFAPEALEHDLGRIFLGTGVICPLAGLERALDVELRTLLHIFLNNVDQPLVEDHDPMPLGPLLALAAVLVAPRLRGRERQVRDARPILGAADLGVAPDIAHENHLVHAARHRVPRLSCHGVRTDCPTMRP